MRALLLSAGLGTRLRPLTNTTPKCMVDINGVPLLGIWLDFLFVNGFDRVLINTHWLPCVVVNYIKTSRWINRIDIVHETELLGTAGTIRSNYEYFGNDDFFVAHADNLVFFDLIKFIDSHNRRPERCVMSMLSFRAENPNLCGILEIDEQSVVQKFHEKIQNPPNNLANGAIYIFTHHVLNYICKFNFPIMDISTQVIPNFLDKIFCIETNGYLRDIGSIDSLEQARIDFKNMMTDKIK